MDRSYAHRNAPPREEEPLGALFWMLLGWLAVTLLAGFGAEVWWLYHLISSHWPR